MISICGVTYVSSARIPSTPIRSDMATRRASRGEVDYKDGWKTPGIYGLDPGDQVVVCRGHKALTGGLFCGSA